MEPEHAFLPLFAVVLSLGVAGLLVVPSWSMLFAALAAVSCLGIGVVAYATYWY